MPISPGAVERSKAQSRRAAKKSRSRAAACPASVNVRVELPWDGATLAGHGRAQLLPGDPDVPDIGRRIAVSRALHDLAERLAFIADADLAGERERRRSGGHPAPR